MKRVLSLVSAAALLVPMDAVATPRQEFQQVLTFESIGLEGWGGGPPETLSQDSVVVREGRYAGRIERSPESAGGGGSAFTYTIPRTFAGEQLVLRGWLRTADLAGYGGLWLRQDGRSGPVQFDDMADSGLSGTSEWTQYTISLPLDDRARTIFLGALLAGAGTLWADDLELLVDGRPIEEAPPFVPTVTGVELDTEFDTGSGIEVVDPSPVQVERLALLGRVWGFAKYHHPRVRSGDVNWDYELFRVLPSVLDAPDRTSALGAISAWLDRIGAPPSCGACAVAPTDAHLSADLDWIEDRSLLGGALSDRLQLIYERRPASRDHHYVSHMLIGNPDFSNESNYAAALLPDSGFRLLALYRFWNVIEYWFPYRDLVVEDWDDVLAEFVPRLMLASTADQYRLAMMELTARIDDTHANIWSFLTLQPPQGPAQLPVVLRFIEGQAVVTGYNHEEFGPASGLRVGDVIQEIDDRAVAALVAQWRPYYSASNQPTRLRDIARNLTRGPVDTVRIRGSRATGDFEVTTERVPINRLDLAAGRTHDRPGETFQLLSPEVAYLKLSSVVAAEVGGYLERAADADVLVVDIRNYPSQFVVFALGGHLVTQRTEFARFTGGDPTNPGAFLMGQPSALAPLAPHFDGPVVILVDEVSQSQAEYTTMALRAGTNSVVVGSTTAGADGNVSPIPLPGGISSMISGIGVFYPNGTPTQQVGILPDLVVTPTIEGIREGRDEVLEAGVSYTLGRTFRVPR